MEFEFSTVGVFHGYLRPGAELVICPAVILRAGFILGNLTFFKLTAGHIAERFLQHYFHRSGLVCPHCDKEIDIFGAGGGEKMADEMGAVFLGRIPMEMAIREGGDAGRPIVLSHKESLTAQAFETIAQNTITVM